MSNIFDICKRGNLNEIKNIITNDNINDIFKYCCRFGHLEIVKCLLLFDKNINIRYDNEYAFRDACYNGHLEVVKYLISLDKNINIHAENEEAFRKACYEGHVEIIKYLISITDNLDNYKNTNNIFVNFLIQIKEYKIEKDKSDGKILNEKYIETEINNCLICENPNKYFLEYTCSVRNEVSCLFIQSQEIECSRNHLICIDCFYQCKECYYCRKPINSNKLYINMKI